MMDELYKEWGRAWSGG